MKTKMLTMLIVGVICFTATFANAQTFGSWLRKKADSVDRKVQNNLNRRPKLQKNINRGIDRFADNLIDFATPEADENCRKMQKDAVQLVLNPNRRESSRHLNNMVNRASGRSSKTGSKRVSRRRSSDGVRYTGISERQAQKQSEHKRKMSKSRAYRSGHKVGETVKKIKNFFKR